MRIITLIFVVLLMGTASLKAQHLSSSKGAASFGVGTGLPYGGIGGRLSFNPGDNVTMFGGLGYNFGSIGANGGLQLIIPSQKQTEFYFTGMYGYNAVMASEIVGTTSRTYYGASFGVGLKINSLSTEGNYWDVGILAPIRSKRYKDDIEAIENNPYMKLESKPWPILFYVGYNFNIASN
jgi:hypothetical protein